MGTGYALHCPECNYWTEFRLGVGMAYPLVYAETQEKGKRGELGEDIKEFFAEHPDGVIDPVPAIFYCENCKRYDAAPSLKMYMPDETKLPREKPDGAWSVAMPFHGTDYVFPGGFEANFVFFKEHTHTCGSIFVDVVDIFDDCYNLLEEVIAEAYSAKWKKYAADELIQVLEGL